MRLFILLIFILLQQNLFAENWIGISAFGIMSKNFQGNNCQTFIRTINRSERPAISLLYKTFGNDPTCLKRFWKKMNKAGKPHLTQIHFTNEFGRKKHFMDKADFLPEQNIKSYNQLLEEMPSWLENILRERVRDILELISEGEDLGGTFIISTGLEDNFTNQAWSNLYNVIDSEWPYQIVRSPALTRQVLRENFEAPSGIYIEKHGYSRRLEDQLCVANGDGHDVNFLQGGGTVFRHAKPATMKSVKSWIKRGTEQNCIMFLWAGKWQGYFAGSDSVPLPLSRKFKFDKEDVPVIEKLFRHNLKVLKKISSKKLST